MRFRRNRHLFAVLYAAIFSLQSMHARAQDYPYGSFIFLQETPGALYLVGKIASTDDFELRRALREHSIETVVLMSSGGSVIGGLAIAGIIGDRKLRVYVPPGAICASACSYVYFAGNERRINGSLGVHQFASSDGDRSAEIGKVEVDTQAVTAEILGFLREFGTPSFVSEHMFRSPEMYWFNDEQAQALDTPAFTLPEPDEASIDETVKVLQSVLEAPVLPSPSTSFAPSTVPEISRPTPIPSQTEVKKQAHIEYVQRRLNDLGCAAGAIDGIIGQKSQRALKHFLAATGIDYFDGVIFDAVFLQKLENAQSAVCLKSTNSPTPRTKAGSTPIPLMLATHWEMTCKVQNGQVLEKFFARVVRYDSQTGNVSLVITNQFGAERSVQGVVRAGAISLYDQTGKFNESYSRFTISDPDCPGGVIAIALVSW